MQFKNIIFDFGGVFIEVDYHKTAAAFKALGITNFDDLYSQHEASSLFQNLETGKLSPQDFCGAIRQISQKELNDNAIISAWNAMLGQYLPTEINILSELKNQYRLILFSNTNEIHYNAFVQLYQQHINKKPFHEFFHSVYYSHQCGYRKPDKESFHSLLQQEHIAAEQTLFIDDTLVNCIGATEAGIASIHLSPPLRLSNIDFSNIESYLISSKSI